MKWAIVAAAAVIAIMSVGASAAEVEEQRLALVIGNRDYNDGWSSLKNPANDAALMADTLRQRGFTVTSLIDADKTTMSLAVTDFAAKLKAAKGTAVGLFYYAGHGLQWQGSNYLVPKGAKNDSSHYDTYLLSVTEVREKMQAANAGGLNIVVLDACRNEQPLTRGGEVADATRGFYVETSAVNVFIAYSTDVGKTASDGAGNNSPYALALSNQIQRGGPLQQVFNLAGDAVVQLTQAAQIPWTASSPIRIEFWFGPKKQSETVVASKAPFFDCAGCPRMVVVPGGRPFSMGSGDAKAPASERPAHPVSVPNDFAVGELEVTIEQWERCVSAGACERRPAQSSAKKDAPVVDVSWDDAMKYVNWLREQLHLPYRLLSEAEWEYIATAKGQYGVQNTRGGAWEWTDDCWSSDYSSVANRSGRARDALASTSGDCNMRALRGGAANSPAADLRPTRRIRMAKSERYRHAGFRVARDWP